MISPGRHGSRGSVLALLLLAVAVATAAPTRDQVAYWRQGFGEASPQDACVQHASMIFQRVAQAAGTRPEHVPPLLITQRNPQWSQLVMALPDGWVVLSKTVVERVLGQCERPSALGEARLAFILGHELAHQLNGQFWHYRLFEAHTPTDTPTPPLESDTVRQTQELQADQAGIVYAAMAGYPTYAVVTNDVQGSFFHDWMQAHSATHLAPPQRAATVRARLTQILAQVDVFQIGLQLYQAGKYEEAIAAFEAFRHVFDSAEIAHNLAVSHHQLALQLYCLWQHAPLIPFRLSLVVEPVTLATRIRLDRKYLSRGEGPPAERIRTHLDQAITYYQAAIARTPTTNLSHANLGAALVARGVLRAQLADPQGKLADLYAAMHALLSTPAEAMDPALLTTQGVAAFYLEGPQRAKTLWEQARQTAAEDTAAAFNLHLLTADTPPTCLAPQAPPTITTPGTASVETNPVGSYEGDLQQQWGKPVQRHVAFEEHTFTLSQYAHAVQTLSQHQIIQTVLMQEGYTGTSGKGVRIGDAAQVVRTHYGVPSRILPMRQGEVWSYDVAGIAFHLDQGQVVSWLLYD